MTTKSPRETDTELAAIWNDIYAVRDRISRIHMDLLRQAGAKFFYRGRQRVTDMKVDDAIAIVRERAAYVAAYKAEHTTVEADGYPSTDWSSFQGAPWEADRFAESLASLDEREAQLTELEFQARELEATYTGWSRFFLVTSSSGHIHSSTHCSTCRLTTRYGWLPELSGKDEATAVAELGPTLCSVCFPSAPVEWTAGKKITAAQAAKKVAS
jgi:hypothetical protein